MTRETLKQVIHDQLFERFGANAEYIQRQFEFRQDLDYILWAVEQPANPRCPISPEQRIEEVLEKAAWVDANILTPATVQIGDGVTVHLWSDAHAATVIKKTKTTVTVRQDKATLDPDFKPEFTPGGFAAHCTNQDEQSYTYEPDPDGDLYTFRWSNKYCTYGQPGDLQLTKGRHEFYDYNF